MDQQFSSVLGGFRVLSESLFEHLTLSSGRPFSMFNDVWGIAKEGRADMVFVGEIGTGDWRWVGSGRIICVFELVSMRGIGSHH